MGRRFRHPGGPLSTIDSRAELVRARNIFNIPWSHCDFGAKHDILTYINYAPPVRTCCAPDLPPLTRDERPSVFCAIPANWARRDARARFSCLSFVLFLVLTIAASHFVHPKLPRVCDGATTASSEAPHLSDIYRRIGSDPGGPLDAPCPPTRPAHILSLSLFI